MSNLSEEPVPFSTSNFILDLFLFELLFEPEVLVPDIVLEEEISLAFSPVEKNKSLTISFDCLVLTIKNDNPL